MSSTVQICDFTRSFVRWGVDTQLKQPVTVSHKPPFTLNHVRVEADCLAEVLDRRTGRTTPYLLGASCKTEHVNVASGIWTEPNADFSMVAGPDRFLNIKRWDRANKGVKRYPESLGVQQDRQLGTPDEGFTHYAADIRKTAGRIVTDIDELAAIFVSDQRVVSRTKIESERYVISLEYPVVTGNYSTRERYYQVDTGPVLFPDLQASPDDVLASFYLAYVAHIKPDWAEFLVCVPTPVSPEISVHHYSRSVRVNCTNEMIAVL